MTEEEEDGKLLPDFLFIYFDRKYGQNDEE